VGTNAAFKSPSGVAISPDGSFALIADFSGYRLRKIEVPSATVTTIAGSDTSGYTDGAGASAAFKQLIGVAVSPDGSFAILIDKKGCLVKKIHLSTYQVLNN
jgi:DNA-binding beta-propeller fold protein YncE